LAHTRRRQSRRGLLLSLPSRRSRPCKSTCKRQKGLPSKKVLSADGTSGNEVSPSGRYRAGYRRRRRTRPASRCERMYTSHGLQIKKPGPGAAFAILAATPGHGARRASICRACKPHLPLTVLQAAYAREQERPPFQKEHPIEIVVVRSGPLVRGGATKGGNRVCFFSGEGKAYEGSSHTAECIGSTSSSHDPQSQPGSKEAGMRRTGAEVGTDLSTLNPTA
jgi:hypothetical protein